MKKLKTGLLFARNWLKNPRQCGALFQTSSAFTSKLLQQVDFDKQFIIELGPGLGNITTPLQAQIKHNFACVEIEEKFCKHLHKQLPHVRVVHGSADKLPELLPEFVGKTGCIVSLIPMVSLKPKLRKAILDSCMTMLADDGYLLQGSYYWKPIAVRDDVDIQHMGFVWKNIPPIHIYKYSKRPL